MYIVDLINKKRNNGKFSKDEIDFIVSDLKSKISA